MADHDREEYYEEPQSKSGCGGCFFWGCLIAGIAFLLLVVGVPLAGYFAVRHYVNQFTAEEAAPIEVVELPDEEVDALKARFEAFEEAVKADEAPEDFEITARELNGLINSEEDLKGRVFVRIQDGKVGGDLSIPADGFPGGEGRFFNATADFNVSMDGGVLIVTLADATINGAKLPQQMLDSLANENLAKEAYDDPENAKVLRRFESLEIQGDRILLKARRPGDMAPGEFDPDSAPEVESFEDPLDESEESPAIEDDEASPRSNAA